MSSECLAVLPPASEGATLGSIATLLGAHSVALGAVWQLLAALEVTLPGSATSLQAVALCLEVHSGTGNSPRDPRVVLESLELEGANGLLSLAVSPTKGLMFRRQSLSWGPGGPNGTEGRASQSQEGAWGADYRL